MAEYIERETLLKDLQEELDFETSMYSEEQNKYFNMGLKCAVRNVKRQPTADVVEVVRCKDCKHYCLSDYRKPNELKWCDLSNEQNEFPEPTDFCSKGERK